MSNLREKYFTIETLVKDFSYLWNDDQGFTDKVLKENDFNHFLALIQLIDLFQGALDRDQDHDDKNRKEIRFYMKRFWGYDFIFSGYSAAVPQCHEIPVDIDSEIEKVISEYKKINGYDLLQIQRLEKDDPEKYDEIKRRAGL